MGLDMEVPRPVDEAVERVAERQARDRALRMERAMLEAQQAMERQRARRRAVPQGVEELGFRPRRFEEWQVRNGDGAVMFNGAHGNVRRHIVGRTGRNNRPNRKIMLQASKKESDV